MKPKHLKLLRVPSEAMEEAIALCRAWSAAGLDDRELSPVIGRCVKDPLAYAEDARLGTLAQKLMALKAESNEDFDLREPVPWTQWGSDIEKDALDQMRNAARLPVAVRGALMPDAHPGYGLPIGGVLATRNAVIPYAVGVDIACRMKLTVLDLPASTINHKPQRLIEAIEAETAFGMGSHFKNRRGHPVMDEDWSFSGVTSGMKDKAASQLGSSGSGNHFVEFGVLTLDQPDLGLAAGEYLALLSHSGSRGAGAAVADHFCRLAIELHPELPKPLKRLAWLDLASAPGQEYWACMELMGRYAAANHACIHRAIARHLGAEVMFDLENHHNFAWKEQHDGEELIVHRKGATPAGAGVLGVIPGSMADPGFVVRGKGVAASLNSASHGAGRRMSRSDARRMYHKHEPVRLLRERGVTLLSAGADELPMVYKDIRQVMADQADLVEVVARFDPRIVKMAPAGEKAED
jgi:tRNA-splicing ligase RtcB